MKISVITLHSVKNYGSILQTIATQDIFEKNGFQTEIINYIRSDIGFFRKLLNVSKNRNIMTRLGIFIVLFPTEIKFSLMWNYLYKKHLNLTRNYRSFDELMKDTPKADIYCSGSDQVWNSNWNGGLLKEFFLEFAPVDAKRISFSSSLGMHSIPEEQKHKFKEMLSKYSSISVREKQSLIVLKEIGIDNAVSILDPTLVKTSRFWENYFNVGKKVVKKKYVLLYQLSKNTDLDSYAKNFSHQTGLQLIRIALRYDQVLKNGKKIYIPSLKNFLNLFYHADFILTDSFHGLSFSLNFNKQFGVFLPTRFSERLTNILDLTHTSDRVIYNINDYSIFERTIEYSKINSILEHERGLAQDYLDKALLIKNE